MTHLLNRVCPFCYTDNTSAKRLPLGPKKWPLKSCGACGFIYLEKAAAYVEMEENFAWEKTSKMETERRTAEEPTISKVSNAAKKFRAEKIKRDKLGDLIREQVKGTGTVVDIGCANGNALKALADRYPVAGVEISRDLAAKAAKKLPSANIIQADAVSGLRQLDGNSCACVIMSSFLEHEIEPRLLLEQTLRVLRPGEGVAIIKVPNFACLNRRLRKEKWCGLRFPDHVNYFTPKSIVAMARSLGFEIRRFRLQDHHPFSDNLWIVISKPATPITPTSEARACSRPEVATAG